MSGRHIVMAALAEANDPNKHHGQGFTVNLWMHSGR
jgi:hypothetical protein